jgi:hypothetical protein
MTNDIHRIILSLAAQLFSHFWVKRGSILVRTNGCTIRFSPHPRQIGFANAGDARPSHWRPLAERIFRAVQEGGFRWPTLRKGKLSDRLNGGST